MGPQSDQPKDDFTETHYNNTVKNHRQGENLESSKKKKFVTYKRTLIKLSAAFLGETLQALRE